MAFDLRGYQATMNNETMEAWENPETKNVLQQLSTGGGKTRTGAKLLRDMNLISATTAHRQELVLQLSIALADEGIVHNLLTPTHVTSTIIQAHIKEVGQSFYNSQASTTVGGIDTIKARHETLSQWFRRVQLWWCDEAHHVVTDNKWGWFVEQFPDALGLGSTATPIRGDRKSLHSLQGGKFDHMVKGPSMRWMIRENFLTKYKIYGSRRAIDTATVPVSKSTGDFNQAKLREAVDQSEITGDIVGHYLKYAKGLSGITFCVDIKSATKAAKAYREAGVPAEVLHGKTSDTARDKIMADFKARRVLQICNCDILGEGVDVPQVGVVSLARPTESLSLYLQQVGRCLRPHPESGKTHGIILDHVGAVVRHGLPDTERNWKLYDEHWGKKRPRDLDLLPTTSCPSCLQPFERITNQCPHCGFDIVPADRSEPQFVDGDLLEYSPELIEKLRAERDEFDNDFVAIPEGATPIIVAAKHKQDRLNKEAQGELRDCIALWAGVQKYHFERDDHEIYKRFYHAFEIDIASAQLLKRKPAVALTEMIRGTMT